MNGDARTETWHLAQIKPNCLQIAERNLRRQGFRIFLPRIQETRRRRDRFSTILKPLFPGYVFVAFDAARQGCRTINSTYGISRLVNFGSKPATVPAGLVGQLQQRCDDDSTFQPAETLHKGDAVRVTTGPFADFMATIEQITPDRRVWILIDLMGRETRAAVEPRALRVVG